MKVTISQKEQTSTFKPTEVIQMSIADTEESRVMMFESLITQYQFPIQTGVQEIVSNARDSHRVAQTNKAIDIQLPTEMNPEWYCRDYGTGIAPDNMGIFMTLFQSTKRSNNNLTGGFGLGCKSFYSYTDSFTVVSYYDGEMRTYRASRAKNPLGELSLLSCVKTKEPNGIKIQVAVKPSDRSQFKNAVIRLMTYWKDQPINVINDKSIKIEQPIYEFQNVSILPTNHSGSNIELVIDGIPYGINNFQSDTITKFKQNLKNSVSIQINNGDVDLSKFREYIIVSESNKDKIHAIINNTIKKITALKMEIANNNVYSSINEIKTDTYKMIFSYFKDCPVFIKLNNKKVECLLVEDHESFALRIPVVNKLDKMVGCFVDSNDRVKKNSYNMFESDKLQYLELDIDSEKRKMNYAYVDTLMSHNQANLKINQLTKNNDKNGTYKTFVISKLKEIVVNGNSRISEYGIATKEVLSLCEFLIATKISLVKLDEKVKSGVKGSVYVKEKDKRGNLYPIKTQWTSIDLRSWSQDVVVTEKTKDKIFKVKTVYVNNRELLQGNQDKSSKDYLKLKAKIDLLTSFGYDIVFIPKSYEASFDGVANLQSMDDVFATKFKPTKDDISHLMTNFKSTYINLKFTIEKSSFDRILKKDLCKNNEVKIIQSLIASNEYFRSNDKTVSQYEKNLTDYVENGNVILKNFIKEIKPMEDVLNKYSFLKILKVHDHDKKEVESFCQLVRLINKGK